MITINSLTNKTVYLKTVDDFIPFLKRIKTFRNVTPLVHVKIQNAIALNLHFNSLKNDFMSFIKKDIFPMRRGKFKPAELIDVFGWTENEVSASRWTYDIAAVDDFIPHLSKVSKSWRRLTPKVSDRLKSLISSSKVFLTKGEFDIFLRKEILEMRSGTFSYDHYITIFGWTEIETNEMMSIKRQIFKEHAGSFTPGQEEFYIAHYGVTAEEAKIAVGNSQRKLSKRKKKTTINQPTSINFYLHRGMTEEDAASAQSLLQKKRRNNCVEYWLSRGYSLEDAKLEISAIQKTRSMLSIEYWLSRGYSIEEAQEGSEMAQKCQMPGKVSKISQKFFNEVLDKLEVLGINRDRFLFGENEKCVFITEKRRVYLDFYDPETNKVVEFDGKYWHKSTSATDTSRDSLLENMGYQILRIPETYNKQQWDKYINQTTDFINGK